MDKQKPVDLTLKDKAAQKALGLWAAKCAEHVLPLFEEQCPNDPRPREAIQTLREWVKTGEFHMAVIRGASLGAHAAAREAKLADSAACFAARAAGQAVATAHVPAHALGAALYAIKAVAAIDADQAQAAAARERAWQSKRVPGDLREWVDNGLREKQQILPANLRILVDQSVRLRNR